MSKDDSDYTPPPPRNAETGADRAAQAAGGSKGSTTHEPGWYPYKNTGVERHWDGGRWTGRMPRPASIRSYVVLGAILQIVGGLVLMASVDEVDGQILVLIGGALVAIGGFLVLVGVIAAGVRLGNSWSDYERDVRSRPPGG